MAIKFPSALDALAFGRTTTSSYPGAWRPGQPFAEPIADRLIKATAEKLSKTTTTTPKPPKKKATTFDQIVDNTVAIWMAFERA